MKPIVYVDDILLQSPIVAKMQLQLALNQLYRNCVSLGLVVNEEKNKYQCMYHRNISLTLNMKAFEVVQAYRYVEMYIGYNKIAKNGE